MLTMHAPSSPSQQLSKHTIRYAIHHEKRRFQRGFSLLELVVVMGILAIFASVSLTFVGEKDVQQRYQQSIEKLQAVKRNFFSVDKFQGQTVMHGFFVDNGMMGEDDVVEAITTSFKTILNIRIDEDETNDPALKDKYRPFGFIDEIYIEDSSENVASQKIESAGIYKGMRPGAYDLSESQDNDNEIRDAWGDEFLLGKYEPEDSDDPVKFISLTVDESQNYKNFDSAKVSVSTYVADVSIKAAQLNINVENLLESGNFRIAIASFKNSNACKTAMTNCWTTTLSKTINIYTLDEVSSSGDTFNEEDDKISSISPVVSTTVKEALTNLHLTDDNINIWKLVQTQNVSTNLYALIEITSTGSLFIENNDLIKDIPSTLPLNLTSIIYTTESNSGIEKKWQLALQNPNQPNAFAFEQQELTIGSHVAVLLKEDTSLTPTTWEIHNIGTTTNPIHVFEYVHIFPSAPYTNITLRVPSIP